MAVPTHFRFVIKGGFKGTDEEWSYSLKFQREVEGQPDAGLDDVDKTAFAARVQEFHESVMFGSHIQLKQISGYVIDTTGHMEGNPWHAIFATPYPDGSATPWVMPSQVALAITLEAQDRGPARFGRFYLPTVNVGLDTDGTMGPANAGVVLGFVVDYLKDLSDTIDLAGLNSANLVNVSTRGSGGTIKNVWKVRVGQVLDTQRRRRAQLEEKYISSGPIDW